MCFCVTAPGLTGAAEKGKASKPAKKVAVQADAYDLSVPELAEQANKLVTLRKFEEALPLINLIIKRLEALSEKLNPTAAHTLEWAHYHIGVCQLETDLKDEALTSLDKYLKLHPKGEFLRAARLLQIECYAALEHWLKVTEKLPAILKEAGLNAEQTLTAHQLLGEAFYRIDKAREAMPSLQFVFDRAKDPQARNRAAVQILGCYVRLEQIKELFEFLPAVYRTSARYDIGLNLALVEAGDNNYDKGRFDIALLFYRLVFFKKELVSQVEQQIAAFKQQRTRGGTLGMSAGLEVVTQKRALDRLVATHQDQLKLINDFPDYDQEVIFRIARTYNELKRHWEALLLFRSVYEDYPTHRLAQEGLYSAFITAMEMKEDKRALKEGYDYVTAYPNGTFWDAMTVLLCQLHVQRGEYKEAIAMGEQGLKVHPKHDLRDQMLYLMGYAYFHMETYDPAMAKFVEVSAKHQHSAFREPAEYWHALAQLFSGNYPKAREEFAAFLKRYKEGGYREDAAYRIGVAQYGENDFKGATSTFQKFIADFPNSPLRADAHSMIGDIAAAEANLDFAIESYQKAMACADLMIQVTYAALQSARVYELEKRNEEIIKLFRDYLAKYGEKGNYTEATYWIGTAQTRAGRPEEAFQTFFDAIINFGHKPENFGIDMILRDMISERAQRADPEMRKRFIERLHAELEKARLQKRLTLELRLLTLFAETTNDPKQREELQAALLNERNLAAAAPLTLNLMGRLTAEKGNHALAKRIHTHFLEKYSNSDLALEPLTAMARYAIAEGKLKQTVPLLKDILNRFAVYEEAGWAQKTLADVARQQKKFKEAVEAYNNVLSLKEWRGPLWPESLYGIGLCHLDQQQPREAFAFFQRVYVLYERYSEWSARAYLKSAECLEKLGQRDDAVKTYREMLGKEALANLPEADVARRELKRLSQTLEAKIP